MFSCVGTCELFSFALQVREHLLEHELGRFTGSSGGDMKGITSHGLFLRDRKPDSLLSLRQGEHAVLLLLVL